MNTIHLHHSQYIRRASRTLETVEIPNANGQKKLVWIYNFEGKHFRLFESERDALNLVDSISDRCLIDFEAEIELDKYLMQLNLE